MKMFPTKQQIFDTIVAGLRGQRYTMSTLSRPSGSGCAYRGPNGRKCAAGHILPDNEYIVNMEGQRVDGTISGSIFTSIVGKDNMDFLAQMQDIHDRGSFEDCDNSNKIQWEKAWWQIATKNELVYTAPTECSY